MTCRFRAIPVSQRWVQRLSKWIQVFLRLRWTQAKCSSRKYGSNTNKYITTPHAPSVSKTDLETAPQASNQRWLKPPTKGDRIQCFTTILASLFILWAVFTSVWLITRQLITENSEIMSQKGTINKLERESTRNGKDIAQKCDFTKHTLLDHLPSWRCWLRSAPTELLSETSYLRISPWSLTLFQKANLPRPFLRHPTSKRGS